MSKDYKTSKFISKAMLVHGNKYDYSNVIYQSAKTKIEISCHLHGPFYQVPNNHLSGYGCKKCGRVAASKNQKLTISDFITKATNIHSNTYDYSKSLYKNYDTKLEIVCKIHGSFWMTATNHINGKQGCPVCGYSSKSKMSQLWLDYMNLPNDKIHREVWLPLSNNTKIRVDGFNPKSNTVYEFWGDYWHGNPKKYNPCYINSHSKILMGELYTKTLTKKKLIINNHFNLVDIWESDWLNFLTNSS